MKKSTFVSPMVRAWRSVFAGLAILAALVACGRAQIPPANHSAGGSQVFDPLWPVGPWGRLPQNLSTNTGYQDNRFSLMQREAILWMYRTRVDHLFRSAAATANAPGVAERIQDLRRIRDQQLAQKNLEPVRETEAGGFSTNAEAAVAAALKLFPIIVLAPCSSDADRWKFSENRRARVEYLSRYLTPPALLAYRLDEDGDTSGIRMILQPLHPTETELRAVFLALDGRNLDRNNGLMHPAEESRLKQALGDQRYAQYRDLSTPENMIYNNFVQMYDLDADQIQKLDQLRVARKTMSEADYRQAVTAVLPNFIAVRECFELSMLTAPGGN